MNDPHSTEFRVRILRKMLNSPPGFSVSDDETPIEEIICIQGLEANGYISAQFRPGLHGIPNGVFNIQVLDKGRRLIADYERERTPKGIWKSAYPKFWPWVFKIIAGIIVAVGSAYLIWRFGLK